MSTVPSRRCCSSPREISPASLTPKWTQRKSEMSAANIKQPKALPPPDSDFYQLVETLPAEDLAVVKQVRAYMETKVQPIINKYWAEDAFPFELLPSFKELNVGGLGMEGYGCRG